MFSLHGNFTFELAWCEFQNVVLFIFLSYMSEGSLLFMFSLHGNFTFELAWCEFQNVVLFIFLSYMSEGSLLFGSGCSKMCWGFGNEFLIYMSIVV